MHHVAVEQTPRPTRGTKVGWGLIAAVTAVVVIGGLFLGGLALRAGGF